VILAPLRAIGPFSRITAGLDTVALRRAAIVRVSISTVVLILGAFVGSAILSKWSVSAGALALAGGLIFLLVALAVVIWVPGPVREHDESPIPRKELYRQLIATLVTPFGLAALALFVRMMPSQTGPILAALVAVMISDLIATVFARPLLKYLDIPLQALARIFGVLQVAACRAANRLWSPFHCDQHVWDPRWLLTIAGLVRAQL
jgi:small neutral amino acid transporter SnatA (MarC family)